MTKSKACPTCGGMQDFRPLTDAEKVAVQTIKKIVYVHDYWRCAVAGCLWFQRYDKRSDGGFLPEEFRTPKPDPDTG
ncbi:MULTISPECIES: hypothetical protein [Streptomyces]|uniref:Uncharacterized protein n=1 Tax=Streptomyces dengpaensis TaxID=2049881 RepID=A0ABM6SVB0_9ACTN|nr:MULTISPECIES: hypothetical protein [Streptomyces]AVH58734.1 hypothetical protein C4B68_26555 [Streptomyces dengpaensis]PIB11204.1 hypothetical protein B1C81_05085 [Streptomyces sp. HG99]